LVYIKFQHEAIMRWRWCRKSGVWFSTEMQLE